MDMFRGVFGRGAAAAAPTTSSGGTQLGALREEGTVECRTCGTEQPFTRHQCMECGKDPWATPEPGFTFGGGGGAASASGDVAASLPPLPPLPSSSSSSTSSAPSHRAGGSPAIARMQLADPASVQMITSQVWSRSCGEEFRRVGVGVNPFSFSIVATNVIFE